MSETPKNHSDAAPPPEDDQYLTTGQAAKLFRMAPGTLLRAAQLNHVPVIRTPGGHRRFRRSDLVKGLGGAA
jgi:excisionase family DNA binding protein